MKTDQSITYHLRIGDASAQLVTAAPICLDCLKVLLEGRCLVDQFCNHLVWKFQSQAFTFPMEEKPMTPPTCPDLPPHSE